MSDSIDFKYRAFLSYAHADTPLAKWLHVSLERFPPRGLSGRETALGPVPKQLRPIFRDREDFSAGQTLNDQTIAALDASAALIVLCSPASAESAAVNEEVRLFKHQQPDRLIVPVILAGKPNNALRECFPPALKFELDGGGQVTSQPADVPIAPDIPEEGRELVLAKVVASLIGVPPDEVYRRAERERKRQARIRNAITAVILLLASAGGYLGWQWRQGVAELTDIAALVDQYAPVGSEQAQQPRARERLRSAFESIAKGFDPRQAKAYQLLKDGKQKEAETLLRELAEDKKAQITADRKQVAEAYRNLGAIAGLADPKRAREYYAEAVSLDPEDRESLYWAGYLNSLAGNLSLANEALSALLKQAAVAADDRALYRAELRLGEIDAQRGSLTTAMEREKRAFAIAERHVKAAPSDAEWQRDLSVSYDRVGDLLKDQGTLPEALKAYRDSLAIFERLAKADPGNAGWQVDVAFAYWRLAANGDKPAEHWRKIIDILQWLDGEGRLAPIHKKWLNQAKAQIAALGK